MTAAIEVHGDRTPPLVTAFGYGALAVAVVIGFAATWSEIASALRI